MFAAYLQRNLGGVGMCVELIALSDSDAQHVVMCPKYKKRR